MLDSEPEVPQWIRSVNHPTSRVAVDDPELYRAIQQAAADRCQPMSMLVAQALREWLEREEEQDDLAAIAEAEGDEVVPWDHVKAERRRTRAVVG